MTTFNDTNVIIYLLDRGSPHHGCAKDVVTRRRRVGPLIICDIVYSEFSVALNSTDETDAAINSLALERLPFTTAALFRAGKAFAEYRRRRGQKTNVLSDFLIGAQAETENAPLKTNNQANFISYFPNVVLIDPTKAGP